VPNSDELHWEDEILANWRWQHPSPQAYASAGASLP